MTRGEGVPLVESNLSINYTWFTIGDAPYPSAPADLGLPWGCGMIKANFWDHNLMRCILLATFWFGVLLVLSQHASLASTVSFPEVGLSITAPAEFTRAESFHGFQQDSTGASLVLASLPGAYREVVSGFTSAGLASQGMTLIKKDSVQIHGQDGLLLSLSQEAYGVVYQKWLVVFGDNELTYLVTANFPETVASLVGDKLKNSALSVKPIALESGSGALDFRITPVAGLKETDSPGALGKFVAYTQTGSFPTETPDEPIFIAAPSAGQPPVSDPVAYAENRLLKTAGIKDISVKSKEPIELDGVAGVKIFADGVQDQTNTPFFVYQVMLFYEAGGYLLMIGMAPSNVLEEYAQIFEATANSFENLK